MEPDIGDNTKPQRTEFALVVFHNIPEIYPSDAHIECKYTITPELVPTDRDWLGLFKVGWMSTSDYHYYEWAPTPKDYEIGKEADNGILFPAHRMPGDDDEFYQFCYVTSTGHIRGASTPFQFKKPSADDFLEIEDPEIDMLMIRSKGIVLEERLKPLEDEREELLQVKSSAAVMASSLWKAQTAIRARGSNKCPHHQGIEVVFMCEDCDGELICTNCVSTIHKKHSVLLISEVIPQVKVTIQDFVNQTESTHLPEFHGKVKNLDDEISRNRNHYKNVIAKIKKQNKNLKLELDKIKNKMIEMFRECEKQNDDIIKNYKTELQSEIEELKARLHEMKEILQTGTDTQIYDTSREIPNDVTIPALPSLEDRDFNPTSILIDQLEKLFGHLTKMNNGNKLKLPTDGVTRPKTNATADVKRDITDKKRTVDVPTEKGRRFNFNKTSKNVVVKFKLFKTFTHQWDIYKLKTISNENRAWVKDLGGKLALLTNTGQVQKTIEMEVDIQDFSVSSSTGDIWFCSYIEKSVRKVTGDNSSTVMFHTDSGPLSKCISADGNILVGMERQIVKYTQRGKVLRKSTKVKQVPVVRYPYSLSQCPITRNIAVLDGDSKDCGGDDKRHVSILSEDLQLFCRYGRDIEWFDPCGVCYSDTGEIYIADHDNRSIQRINGTGQFIQTVHTDRDKPAVRLCVQPNGDIWAVFGWTSVIILQKQ